MSVSDQTQAAMGETLQLRGEQLIAEVRRIIHTGNVTRIVVKQGERTVAEFPLTVGVVGALIAAPLAALGALAALLNDCTIALRAGASANEVERAEPADGAEEQASDR